ncbi:DUF417 family protein, partial [Salmonella enterica subsp. enterica serovar Kentucky]|nr:DUF417 family protein [Salmonella enterica subsp. enterica serovar Kentucky]
HEGELKPEERAWQTANNTYAFSDGLGVVELIIAALVLANPVSSLRSLNSFSRLQEMSGLKEKAGDRFVALDSPFNHVEQGKLVIP